MDYAAGGVVAFSADKVRAWCAANGQNKLLRSCFATQASMTARCWAGWHLQAWTARTKGYAVTDRAVENSASETVVCSHCVPGARCRMRCLKCLTPIAQGCESQRAILGRRLEGMATIGK